MYAFILIFSVIVLLKTASYGIFEVKKNNNKTRWFYYYYYFYYLSYSAKCYVLYKRHIITCILFRTPIESTKKATPNMIVHLFSFPSLVLPLFFS